MNSDNKSKKELVRNIKNFELRDDLRQFLEYDVYYDHNSQDFYGKNAEEKKANEKNFIKLRNNLARESGVDYRTLQDIVINNKFNQNTETEKKLRYLAVRLGLRIPIISGPVNLMEAFTFNDTNTMQLGSNMHLVALTQNYCAYKTAEHSREFAEVCELLENIKRKYIGKFPTDTYTYHKQLVPEFDADPLVKKLWDLLLRTNIALYGRRMNQWLHDYKEDHLIMFKLVKFPDQDKGQPVEAYEFAAEIETFQYVEKMKLIGYRGSKTE